MFGRSIHFLVTRHIILMSVASALISSLVIWTAYDIDRFQTNWSEYIAAREGRHSSLNVLSRSLGYGGLVHNLYNLALRGDERYLLNAEHNIGVALAALVEYRTQQTTVLERIAMQNIEDEVGRIEMELPVILERSVRGDSPADILSKAAIDLDRLTSFLASLERSAEYEMPGEGGSPYWSALRDLWRLSGLNGFIHHFKEYLISGDPVRLQQAREAGGEFSALLDHLEELSETGTQIEALTLIRETGGKYTKALDTVERLHRENTPLREIDRQVVVDDGPALAAFSTLISAELARIERQGRANLSAMQSTETRLWAGFFPFIGIFVALFVVTAMLMRKMLKTSRDALIAQKDAVLSAGRDVALEYPPLLSEFYEALKMIRQIGGALGAANETSRQQKRILDKLPNGIAAFMSDGTMVFFNARMSQLTDIPKSWFSEERSIGDLMGYLASRGDFGSGVAADLARFHVEQIESLEMGQRLQLTLSTVDHRHIEVQIERDISDMFVLSAFDKTEAEKLSRQKEIEARTDWLTGLPNRKAAEEHGANMLAHSRRGNQTMALLALDLDGFKPVNDTLGHAAGDEVLREIGLRLKAELRETDYAARVGGDEFQIILMHLESAQSAERFAHRLVRAIEEPMVIGDDHIVISASIGIACFPLHGETLDALNKVADQAMYTSKKQPDRRVFMPVAEGSAESGSGLQKSRSG